MKICLKKDSLTYFALKFAVIAALLLGIFHVLFPYYLILVMKILTIFSKGFNIHYSGVSILIMPFVSLFALILATPKRTVKDKIKYLVLTFFLFFIIDVSSSIIQLLTPSVNHDIVLLFQGFFTIAMPIVVWFLFSHNDFIQYLKNKDS
ncbi:MAG: hypothetical protein V1900_04105 [Candidatus Aenigmatarchaeota archaeon]